VQSENNRNEREQATKKNIGGNERAGRLGEKKKEEFSKKKPAKKAKRRWPNMSRGKRKNTGNEQ